ncbi:MAG: hypothetical protein N2508_09470 [Anaerolineae bacterium]|nr:hypothetical protein [Anaerolineae bacterium]
MERKAQWIDYLVAVLVLGSLWGFAEVVLGGAMKIAKVPYRSGILTGLGVGLMALAVGAFRRPALLPGMALVAACCKQLVVPILRVSFMCKANSCLAVLLDGVALCGVVALAGRWLDKSYPTRVASGASAALLAAVGFYLIGMRLAPCQYLLSFNRPGGLLAFLGAEGLVWMIFSAIFFPVGYAVGRKAGDVIPAWRVGRASLYYALAAAIVAFSWLASALAIANGI